MKLHTTGRIRYEDKDFEWIDGALVTIKKDELPKLGQDKTFIGE